MTAPLTERRQTAPAPYRCDRCEAPAIRWYRVGGDLDLPLIGGVIAGAPVLLCGLCVTWLVHHEDRTVETWGL